MRSCIFLLYHIFAGLDYPDLDGLVERNETRDHRRDDCKNQQVAENGFQFEQHGLCLQRAVERLGRDLTRFVDAVPLCKSTVLRIIVLLCGERIERSRMVGQPGQSLLLQPVE